MTHPSFWVVSSLGAARQELSSIENFAFDQVHFHYPARPSVKILNGVSLTIQRGQKVAFVGESGSGKSTIMALLERFYDPSSGMVSVDGQDMRKFKISSLRRCIGYVGQEPVLFSQSIRANIMQGNPEASKEQFQQACADAQLGFVENLPEKYNTFVGVPWRKCCARDISLDAVWGDRDFSCRSLQTQTQRFECFESNRHYSDFNPHSQTCNCMISNK